MNRDRMSSDGNLRSARPVSRAGLILALFFFCLFIGAVGPSSAAESIKQDLQQSQKGLQEIQRKLERERQKRAAAGRLEKNVLSRLENADRQIERLNRERKANETDYHATRRRIRSLEELRREALQDLDVERLSLGRRLQALQRGRASDPLLSLALGSQSTGDASRRARFGFLLARSNQRLLERVDKRRGELENTTKRLTRERDRRGRILGALSVQKGRAEKERAARRRLLASVRGEKVVRDAAIRDLSSAAHNLSSKVDELITQAEAKELREKREREEEARRKVEAARRTGAKPLSEQDAPVGVHAPPLVGGGGLKRGMAWPVSGSILQRFGRTKSREFNATVESSGLQIRAAKGSPIKAVASGKVRYADWFQGYGKLVILDHGQGYYSLYAQASDLYVSPGDSVAAGQVIGTVGDTGSLVGDSLYFEIRKNGLPQNPLVWLKQKG